MNNSHLRLTALLGCAFLFSACSGGAGHPSSVGGGTLPAQTRASGRTAQVAFSLLIPRKTGLTPKYISPATQSAGIVVTPSGGNALPTTIINCSTSACSGTVSVPTGSDTFAVSLYSATNATGSVLSSATLMQTIIAGQANTVTLSFDGVPANIVLKFSSLTFTSGTAGSVNISAMATDASGNTIIGTYANPVTLSDSDASGASSLSATTIASSSATVKLNYTAGFTGATVTGSATGCTPVMSKLTAGGGGTPLPNVTIGGGAWAPYNVATDLQFPVQQGYDGTGQTVAIIAIIMDAYPLTSDVSGYLSSLQVPSTTRTIATEASVDGAPIGADTSGEATLDTETIAGLAPGANVIIYGMSSLNTQYFTDTVNQVINDGKASIISYSAGGCEGSGVVANDTVLQAAANAGIAIVASAGDNGNQCYDNGTYVVGASWPATDPNVIGIGGTETDDTTYTYSLTSSTVWNDTTCSGQCAGGGGVSQYFSLPSYQSGLTNESSTTYRNVPDVSMPAEDDGLFFNGTWRYEDGTSWGAPQYAALMAETYEYCNTTVASPVTAAYYVYAHDSAAFIDVTSGTDQFGTSTPYYSAAAGYDDASGLGVPLGMPFVQTLCPNHILAAVARRPQSVSVGLGSSQAYTVDVTPKVAGLTGEGRRGSTEQTRVQVVLRPTQAIAGDESAVIAALQSAGFTIVQTFRNHLVVDAVAPSGTVERFFGTQMENVNQGRYGTRYMPAVPATVPASLAPYVSGINLDDVVTMFAPPPEIRPL